MADLDKIVEEEGEDGEKLKEELTWQVFLVDAEMDYGRYEVFNFLMFELDSKTINEKLEGSAAKINIAQGIFFEILRLVNIDISTPIENSILFEKSHLLYTKADLKTVQGKFDIVEQ